MPIKVDKDKLVKVYNAATYNRGKGQPLDDTSVWYSYIDLIKYAADSKERGYVGQTVTLVYKESDGSGGEVERVRFFILTEDSHGTYIDASTGIEYPKYFTEMVIYRDDELAKKLDKQSTDGATYAYTVKGTAQTITKVSTSVNSGALVMRVSSTDDAYKGQIKVPKTPTDADHATSKQYVDKGVYEATHYFQNLKWRDWSTENAAMGDPILGLKPDTYSALKCGLANSEYAIIRLVSGFATYGYAQLVKDGPWRFTSLLAQYSGYSSSGAQMTPEVPVIVDIDISEINIAGAVGDVTVTLHGLEEGKGYARYPATPVYSNDHSKRKDVLFSEVLKWR